MPFTTPVLKTIRQHQLIRPGDLICVGVSGGADSVALLTALTELRHVLGARLLAGHINHGLRKSAGTDQKYVEHLCRQFKIPCVVVKLSLKRTKLNGSLEERAREARLDSLIRIARCHKAAAVALAHTQDDLAETVLMRILRGTGMLGLRSILPRRVIHGTVFIRPLLDCSRQDVETFLKMKKLKFRTDPTNRSRRFLRNRIRLDLLPLLQKTYNPGIKNVLAGLARTLADDYEVLTNESRRVLKKPLLLQQTQSQIQLSLSQLRKLPTAVRRLTLRLVMEDLTGNLRQLSLAHGDELEDLIFNRPQGSRVDLPGSLQAVTSRQKLKITTQP